MRKLTPKQQRFVDEYLIDLNATQAAIRAGYSAKTARQIGERLLTNVDIQAALSARMKDREARTEITQDKVIADIEAIKRDAMKAIPDRFGNLLMANHAAALKATELQGKHLGMFKERVELTGKDGKPIQTQQVPLELGNLNDDELTALAGIAAKLSAGSDTG